MCRSIKPLFNFDPPASSDEIRAASRQFVRKISGFHKPSKANQGSFEETVERIAAVASAFLETLETSAPPRNREIETAKAKSRAVARYR